MPPWQSLLSVIPAPPSSRSQWSNVSARNDLKPVPFAFSDESVRQKIQTIKRVNDRPPQLSELAPGEKESMSFCHSCAGFSISSSSRSHTAPLPALLAALDIDCSNSSSEMRLCRLWGISRSVAGGEGWWGRQSGSLGKWLHNFPSSSKKELPQSPMQVTYQEDPWNSQLIIRLIITNGLPL